MKTTGVSDIPKFGLLDFLGHPIVNGKKESQLFGRIAKSKGPNCYPFQVVAFPWPMIDYWSSSFVDVSNFYFHVSFLSCLFQVVASPWSVMRFLGENFGYNLPSMPMIGETRGYISSYQICYTFISHKPKQKQNNVWMSGKHLFRKGSVVCRRKKHVYLHFAKEIHVTSKPIIVNRRARKMLV